MNGAPPHERHDSPRDPRGEDPDFRAGTPWRRFIVLGDSGARSRGSSRRGSGSEPWADRVAGALRSPRPELAYLNLSRADQSAAQVRSRQLARALAFRGDLAAVVAGGHEALLDSFDVDATEAELHRIVGALRDSGADVITLGAYGSCGQAPAVAERGGGPEQRLRLLAERTRALALQHGAMHVDMVGAGDGPAGDRERAVAAAVIRRLAAHPEVTRTASW
ncbi:GDSL-type esterase/lipase family protein [Streptomyces sp. NPDC058284]|uniref:GDSL-type esterase/lipase family protein n=1 Tax=unclassified Streptomyces TaxID=2593676 RepID=UPI00364EC1D2